MRWVLHFFEREALRWDDRGKECAIQPVEDREGCIAYAARQASLRRAISQALSASWADTRFCGKNYPSSSRLACGHESRLVLGITVVLTTDNCLERARILNGGTFQQRDFSMAGLLNGGPSMMSLGGSSNRGWD
jgi:hypothetical protein